MGLDLVELVIRVEEEFGIDIPDTEAQQAQTAGKLHELIVGTLSSEHENVCLTSVAFNQVRRALMSVLNVPKSAIRPSTPTNDLIPEKGRAEVWKAVRDSSVLRLPDLETNWINYGDLYPSGAASVGELAKRVVALNHQYLMAERKGWTKSDIWNILCEVLVDQTGVRKDEVTKGAHFVKDLGLS